MRISYLSGNTNQFSGKAIQTLKKISKNFTEIIRPTMPEIAKAWASSDLIVWDWCKGGIEQLTSMPKKPKIIILGKAGDILPRMEYACVRERFRRRGDAMSLSTVTTYKTLKKIKWDKVDLLLFESKHIKDEFEDLYPENTCRKDVVLYRDFKYQSKTKFNNTACIVCRVSIEKDIEFAIKAFRNAPQMKLVVQGPRKSSDHAEWFDVPYFEKLQDMSSGCSNIEFREWGDPSGLYAESSIILSTSISEGIASTVMEGMSRGCYPIVRNWRGADKCYPYARIVSSSDHLCLELMRWHGMTDEEKKHNSELAIRNIKNDIHKGGEPKDIFESKIMEVIRSGQENLDEATLVAE